MSLRSKGRGHPATSAVSQIAAMERKYDKRVRIILDALRELLDGGRDRSARSDSSTPGHEPLPGRRGSAPNILRHGGGVI